MARICLTGSVCLIKCLCSQFSRKLYCNLCAWISLQMPGFNEILIFLHQTLRYSTTMASCVMKVVFSCAIIFGLLATLDAFNGNDEMNLCLAKPFNYTVQLPGCYPKVIKNNFCYGLCRSFFYPRRRRYGLKVTSVCSFCAPVVTEAVVVRLRCHGVESNSVLYKFKMVKVYKSCKCKRSLCEAWPMYH